MKKRLPCFLLIIVLTAPPCLAREPVIELGLQRRDPQTNKVSVIPEKIAPAKVGVVIIDMWDYQGCVTIVGRIGAMVERMNQSLAAARKLGMKVLWSPTDIAGMHVGSPQYERALAFPSHPLPDKQRELNIGFSGGSDSCMCGPGIKCPNNWGFSRQHPDLVIADEDLIITGDQGQLYSICKELGLTHLIFMGVHTNICLTYRGVGAKLMSEAGFRCYLARDLTDPVSYYDPVNGFTPDDGLAQAVRDVEKAMPSINLLEEMKKTGALREDVVVEMVSLVPWGMEDNPYLFEDAVTVTLGSPLLADVHIRYTLDGSEPAAESAIYKKPFTFRKTTLLRAAAFRKGKKVSLLSVGYFARLGSMPPKPDVYMDAIEPMPRTATWPTDPPYLDFFWIPKMNQSYEGNPLQLRGQKYDKGMGMRAPGNFLCEVKPEYERFVALAGVDENILNRGNGALVASTPSVQFGIFIDGNLAAESPVLKVNHVPWRFDVKIPEGARIINLTATDAGSRSMLDLANWVDAGFILRKHVGAGPGPKLKIKKSLKLPQAQSIATDGKHIYTFPGRLVKYDMNGNELAQGDRDDRHFGGFTYLDGKIYAAVSQCSAKGTDNHKVVVFSAESMKIIAEHDIGSHFDICAGGMEYFDGHFYVAESYFDDDHFDYIAKFDKKFNPVDAYRIDFKSLYGIQGLAYLPDLGLFQVNSHGNAFYLIDTTFNSSTIRPGMTDSDEFPHGLQDVAYLNENTLLLNANGRESDFNVVFAELIYTEN